MFVAKHSKASGSAAEALAVQSDAQLRFELSPTVTTRYRDISRFTSLSIAVKIPDAAEQRGSYKRPKYQEPLQASGNLRCV